MPALYNRAARAAQACLANIPWEYRPQWRHVCCHIRLSSQILNIVQKRRRAALFEIPIHEKSTAAVATAAVPILHAYPTES
jgi:hypothetical protein